MNSSIRASTERWGKQSAHQWITRIMCQTLALVRIVWFIASVVDIFGSYSHQMLCPFSGCRPGICLTNPFSRIDERRSLSVHLNAFSSCLNHIRNDRIVPQIGEPDLRPAHIDRTRREESRTSTIALMLVMKCYHSSQLTNCHISCRVRFEELVQMIPKFWNPIDNLIELRVQSNAIGSHFYFCLNQFPFEISEQKSFNGFGMISADNPTEVVMDLQVRCVATRLIHCSDYVWAVRTEIAVKYGFS